MLDGQHSSSLRPTRTLAASAVFFLFAQLSCTTHSEHHVLPRRRPLYPCLRRPCGCRQQLQHRPRAVLQQAREGTSQTSSLISCAGLPWLTWTKFTGGLCCRRGDPVRSRRGCPGRDGEDRVGVLAHLCGRGRERQHLLFPARVLREQQCCECFVVRLAARYMGGSRLASRRADSFPSAVPPLCSRRSTLLTR